MKKPLRYLVNTILFVVIFSIPTIFIMGYAVSQYGTRPNALSAFGPILGLLIAYILVKRINKSNLWASLFDETELVNYAVKGYKEKFNLKLLFLIYPIVFILSQLFFFFSAVLFLV